MSTQVDSPIQTCLMKNPEEKEDSQDPKKHWIKFKILDESGKPVRGITVQIKLPDNSISENTSDEKGMIEINNIDPGECSFATDWKELTVGEIVYLKS
jgi:hypothetical protein